MVTQEPKANVPHCWSIRQVAEYLGVSVKTVRRMVDDGSFPKGRRFAGRTVRWKADAVQVWFDRRPAA
jgi:excisionase family DNA binding protein